MDMRIVETPERGAGRKRFEGRKLKYSCGDYRVRENYDPGVNSEALITSTWL